MRSLIIIISGFILIFGEINIANAQIARKHLVSKGNLLITTGNPTPVDKGDTRIYGAFRSLEQTDDFNDSTQLETMGNAFAAAADFKLQSGAASIGYSFSDEDSRIDISGTVTKFTQEVTQYAAQYVRIVNIDLTVAGTVILVNDNREISVNGFSGAAEHDYVNLVLGGNQSVYDGFRIGLAFSPPVSSSETFGGAFIGLESKAGHGLVLQGGIGYSTEDLSIGIDGFLENENKIANAEGNRGAIFSGEIAITNNLILGGSYTIFERDDLTDGTDFISPQSNGTVIEVEVFVIDPTSDFVAGVSFLKLSEEFFDFGDVTADSDRLDKSDVTAFTITISNNF